MKNIISIALSVTLLLTLVLPIIYLVSNTNSLSIPMPSTNLVIMQDPNIKKYVIEKLVYEISEPINLSLLNAKSKYTIIYVFEQIYNNLKILELSHIVSIFNNEVSKFSDKFETLCVNLMEEAYKQNIFYDFKNYSELKELELMTNKIKESNIQKYNIIINAYDTIITTASATITGDINTPIVFAGQTIKSIYKFIKTIKSENTKVVNVHKTSQEELEENNENIYNLSKFYCTNIGNIYLQIEDNNIYVIGDKVNPNIVLKFVSILEKNIEYKIKIKEIKNSYANRNSDVNKDVNLDTIINEDLNTYNIVLQSLIERIKNLKNTIQYLSDITSYMIYLYINKTIMTKGVDSVYYIKKYFIKILNKLNNFVSLIQLQFPEQEQKINKTKEYIENNYKIQLWKNEIEYLLELYKNYQIKFDNKIENIRTNSSIYKIKNKSYEYVDYYLEKIKLYSFGLKNILRGLTKNILEVPAGIVEGIFDLIFSYISKTLFSFNGIIIILLVIIVTNASQFGKIVYKLIL